MSLQTDIKRVDCRVILKESDEKKKAEMMQYLAQQCRLDVFDTLHNAQTGHWGGASSAAELLVTLYFHIMNVRTDEPRWQGRDRLVLSKGHASCMLYSVLANRGFFELEELSTFRKLHSRLQGHPCMNKLDCLDMSTGSLGHGLSIGLGMAMASEITGADYWSFVLVGDGCLNEGQTWEAVMAAAKFKPKKLVLMIDYNKVQLDGPSDNVMPMDPLPDKFKAFNWNVCEQVFDGHSVGSILKSWQWIKSQKDSPVAVIYKTHKGHGISFTSDQSKWHGAPIDKASYKQGRPELMKRLKELEAAID
jgi:transketolase